MAIGTSTTQYALGEANSRHGAYSAISGSGLWYVVYSNGTNFVSQTSSNGSTWSGTTTIPPGPNGGTRIYEGCLVAVSSGILHVALGGIDADYQIFSGSSWLSSPLVLENSQSSHAQLCLYETGGHVYARAPYNSGANRDLEMVLLDPASGGSFGVGHVMQDPSGGNTLPYSNSTAYNVSGRGTPTILFTCVMSTTPKQLVYLNLGAAGTIPGTNFTNPTTSLVSNANLTVEIATCSEPATSSANIHLVYHIT